MSSTQQDQDEKSANEVEEVVDGTDDDKQKYEVLPDEASDVQLEKSNGNDSDALQSAQKEEQLIKKKYGLLLKKKPLISKDHEHAFFDSADWALGKQLGAQKPKGQLEELRPKLQPMPHHQMRTRRSTYAPADNSEDEASTTIPADDQNISDTSNNQTDACEEHCCCHKPTSSPAT